MSLARKPLNRVSDNKFSVALAQVQVGPRQFDPEPVLDALNELRDFAGEASEKLGIESVKEVNKGLAEISALLDRRLQQLGGDARAATANVRDGMRSMGADTIAPYRSALLLLAASLALLAVSISVHLLASAYDSALGRALTSFVSAEKVVGTLVFGALTGFVWAYLHFTASRRSDAQRRLQAANDELRAERDSALERLRASDAFLNSVKVKTTLVDAEFRTFRNNFDSAVRPLAAHWKSIVGEQPLVLPATYDYESDFAALSVAIDDLRTAAMRPPIAEIRA